MEREKKKLTSRFLINLFTLTLIDIQQERREIGSAALLTSLQQLPSALEEDLNRCIELP